MCFSNRIVQLTSFMEGSSYCLHKRKFLNIETIVKDFNVNPVLLSPIHQQLGFAFVRIESGITLVPILVFSGNPTNVSWFIISVVVDPVDGMERGWLIPNIDQEILKRVFPLTRHSNPSTAVVFVVSIRGVETPSFNTLPNRILRTFTTLPMLSLSIPSSLSVVASTTITPPGSEVVGGYDTFCPTIAHTVPKSTTRYTRRFRNHYPAVESLTSKIDETSHADTPFDGFDYSLTP